jgi:hypothetical protein
MSEWRYQKVIDILRPWFEDRGYEIEYFDYEIGYFSGALWTIDVYAPAECPDLTNWGIGLFGGPVGRREDHLEGREFIPFMDLCNPNLFNEIEKFMRAVEKYG